MTGHVRGKGSGSFLRHPAQLLVLAFAGAIAVGTLLLLLPAARQDPHGLPLLTALFTATSAVCVTGLTTVDTVAYWTPVGKVIILGLIQIGGFGIMTLASLLALVITKRLGLRTRLTAAAETKSLGPGEVRRVLVGVFRITVVMEVTVALVLSARFLLAYGYSPQQAIWHGGFHSISAFNNAGFALYSDSMMGFVTDAWICVPIAVAVIVGGLGFPVLSELLRRVPMRRWSLHTRLTLLMTGILLAGGWLFLTANEWGNPRTIGELDPAGKLLAGFFQAVQPRTAGFNSWDWGVASDTSVLGTTMLMFIGGGSASTAGGLKVTTFILLFFAILAEARGEPDVTIFDRRISPRTLRQATSIAIIGIASVLAATMVMLQTSDLTLRSALFEATSAFGTVGLSTGVTPNHSTWGQIVLIGLMFLGRLGPVTLVSALTMREHVRRYTLPEGRPLIG